MEANNPNQQDRQVETVTDGQWAQMQREAMGEKYPGDAEMAREREAFQQEFEAHQTAREAPAQEAPAHEAPAAQAPAAPAETREWNAREWLNEAFKDDPTFKDLSAEDMSRLEAMANEKHAEFAGEVQDWANEKSAEWSGGLRDSLREGMDSSAKLEGFFDRHLADGEFSDADKAGLEQAAKDMTPAEGAGIALPIVEELHGIHGELIDGVGMIVDHAIDDVHDIVEARAEMPGGESEQVQKMLHDLEDAPDQIHDALEWEREQGDREFGKLEDRLELVEAGTDPKDLPADTDTYQVDDNADQYEAEAA